MKTTSDKRIVIRYNSEIENEIEYLKKIYGEKTTAGLIKRIVGMDYRRNQKTIKPASGEPQEAKLTNILTDIEQPDISNKEYVDCLTKISIDEAIEELDQDELMQSFKLETYLGRRKDLFIRDKGLEDEFIWWIDQKRKWKKN